MSAADEMSESLRVSAARCDGCGFTFVIGEDETAEDYFIDAPDPGRGTYCLFCRAAAGLGDVTR